jgi:KDO2-lipid IV(A) lauroyltransferase
MADEFSRCFGTDPDDETSKAWVQDAFRIGFQNSLEELLLGKFDQDTWSNFMDISGKEHLDKALERGKGAIILFPHAGNVMLLIAAISYSGYPYTQYAARGLAPENVAADHPELLGHNKLREAVRIAREDNEDRMPAKFLTLEASARNLYRALSNNETVGIAFDGRIGSKFVKVPYLGREALLNPGPFRLAQSTGAAIVPAFCTAPPSKKNVLQFGSPMYPDAKGNKDAWKRLMESFLSDRIEPLIRQNPAEYGLWLAHCRMRASIDDHPFFIDYAPDDRYLKHV